jgi:hypothetical protein
MSGAKKLAWKGEPKTKITVFPRMHGVICFYSVDVLMIFRVRTLVYKKKHENHVHLSVTGKEFEQVPEVPK